MTVEQLQARNAELTNQKEALWQQLNAVMGAIEENNNWIAKLQAQARTPNAGPGAAQPVPPAPPPGWIAPAKDA